MRDFRKRLVSSCVLLLVASVALAAGSDFLEKRSVQLLVESKVLVKVVDACQAGQCADTADIVAQFRKAEQALMDLRADIDASTASDGALLRAHANVAEAETLVNSRKTIVRFWEETW